MKWNAWIRRLTDLLSLWTGVLSAFHFRFYSEFIPVFTPIPDLSLYFAALLVLSPIYLLFMESLGNYQTRTAELSEYEIHNLFRSLIFFYLICLSLSFFIREYEFSRITLVLSFFLTFLSCLILRRLIGRLESPRPADRILLIGANPELLAEVRKAFNDSGTSDVSVHLYQKPFSADLSSFDRTVIAGGDIDFADLADLIVNAPPSVRIDLIPGYHLFLRHLPFKESIGLFPVLPLNQQVFTGWSSFTKRTIDVCISGILLLMASPLLLLITAMIRLLYGRPVLFHQSRVGQNGLLFSIYKFRTMKVDAEMELVPVLQSQNPPNYKKKDDPRVLGKFARFLRRTSLDEVPQFWNVLQGSMSLVGPRPAPLEFVRNYSPIHKLRLSVPPGMTGLQQIHCRGAESIDEILQYDMKYLREQSLWLDFIILLKTIPSVLLGKGTH